MNNWFFYKFTVLKLIRNPWNVFFGFFIPIFFNILIGCLWGKEKISSDGSTIMQFAFPSLIIMAIITHSSSSLPISMSVEKLTKRWKQLSLTNTSKREYLNIIMISNYTSFFISFFICWTISTSFFGLQNKWYSVLSFLILPMPIFLSLFFLSIIIVNFSNQFKTAIICSFLVFYVLLLTSGAMIPSYLMPEWFKYIQFLTPAGCGAIMLSDFANFYNLNQDWYFYLLLFCYLFIFMYIAIKFYDWN